MTNPAQPPYQPPPVPPKKKRRKWPWIILGIIVVIILIAALSGGGDDSSTTSSSGGSGATATAKKDEGAAGLNTPVRDGKFEFTVTGVEKGLDSVGDNPYLAKKAQGQFVIVSVTVKNTASKPQAFGTDSQKLFDSQGRSFTNDSAAQIAVGDDPSTAIYGDINPGNSVKAKLVFDMPADATPATIELHDSPFSGGVKVKLA